MEKVMIAVLLIQLKDIIILLQWMEVIGTVSVGSILSNIYVPVDEV